MPGPVTPCTGQSPAVSMTCGTDRQVTNSMTKLCVFYAVSLLCDWDASHFGILIKCVLRTPFILRTPFKGNFVQGAWGRDFVNVSKSVGLDLSEWTQGHPLLPAPTQIGDWTDRAVTSSEVQKWLQGILRDCKDFDPTGFTPHGCKATTLLMLSRYGATPEDRLILGHHQVNRGALEVYARDLQSAPLRVLEQMFSDIRCGRFSPDVTRSGMFTPGANPGTVTVPISGDVSPVPTTPIDDTAEPDCVSLPSERPAFSLEARQDMSEAPESEKLNELEQSDSSDSDFSPDESDDEEVLKGLASSARPPGHWHPGCTLYQHCKPKLIHALSVFGHRKAFVCGRAPSKEYVLFEPKFFVDAMKCQQCDKGHAPTDENVKASSLGAAVKRARKQ
eukprot:s1511_g14.t1